MSLKLADWKIGFSAKTYTLTAEEMDALKQWMIQYVRSKVPEGTFLIRVRADVEFEVQSKLPKMLTYNLTIPVEEKTDDSE